MPSTYDRPRPRGPVRCMTCSRPSLAAASRSATSPVPSGEPSSTMRTLSPSMASRRGMSIPMLSRSLYVGTTTRAAPSAAALVPRTSSLAARRRDEALHHAVPGDEARALVSGFAELRGGRRTLAELRDRAGQRTWYGLRYVPVHTVLDELQRPAR